MNEREQDEMFRGHGGRAKAELLRAGQIELEDLVTSVERGDARLLAHEATLTELRALVADRAPAGGDEWEQRLPATFVIYGADLQPAVDRVRSALATTLAPGPLPQAREQVQAEYATAAHDGAAREVIRAALGTRACLTLFALAEQLPDTPLADYVLGYLLTLHELFARAFAQWVATRSEQPELRAQRIRDEQHSTRYRQWEDDDFEPVGRALDALLVVTTPDPNLERYLAQLPEQPPRDAMTPENVRAFLRASGVPEDEVPIMATAMLTGDDVGL